jgi:hypothetical protein
MSEVVLSMVSLPIMYLSYSFGFCLPIIFSLVGFACRGDVVFGWLFAGSVDRFL